MVAGWWWWLCDESEVGWWQGGDGVMRVRWDGGRVVVVVV